MRSTSAANQPRTRPLTSARRPAPNLAWRPMAARRSTCWCTPHLRPHHDWPSGDFYPCYRQTILDKLKSAAGLADIEERIVAERHLTPHDIHERYRVCFGDQNWV